jgi:hypothetical protein
MQHHVCRLQVTVQDALLVQPLHALRHPQQHLQQNALQDSKANIKQYFECFTQPGIGYPNQESNGRLIAISAQLKLSKLDYCKSASDSYFTTTLSAQCSGAYLQHRSCVSQPVTRTAQAVSAVCTGCELLLLLLLLTICGTPCTKNTPALRSSTASCSVPAGQQ